jgi:hypothetical protein
MAILGRNNAPSLDITNQTFHCSLELCYQYQYVLRVLIATSAHRPFAYAAPSGFKSLNTANLPTPTILKAQQYSVRHQALHRQRQHPDD